MIVLRTIGWAAVVMAALAMFGGRVPAMSSGKAIHVLKPVPGRDVVIDDSFWSPRLALWRGTTVDDCFDKFEKVGAFANFDRVANGERDGFTGLPFWDGLAYETITGASDFVGCHRDPKIEARVDAFVERIVAASMKDPDGYVNTYTSLKDNHYRWGVGPASEVFEDDVHRHDVYNAGCLIEAGAHYYQATGKTDLLAVGTRMANLMCRDIGPSPRGNVVPGHAIAEEALVELCELYRRHPEIRSLTLTSAGQTVSVPVTPDEYLKLAWFFIEQRGNHAGRKDYGAYDQDDRPVLQQSTMEGHAVRSALLAGGVTEAAMVSGRSEYLEQMQAWWSNMVEKRMYVTGGLGAIGTYEGFGSDYELPNDGYAETCANIAGAFFSRNLNQATGDAHYFDVVERELYNGALSHIGLDGRSYFYQNPLSAVGRRREDWAGCPCCPPMFLKLMGGLPGDIYATDGLGTYPPAPNNEGAGIYVNLFVGSQANVTVNGVRTVVRQSTKYPWHGAVTLHVSPERPALFRVGIRVPDWCDGMTFHVDGKPVTATIANHYALIERIWIKGDVVEIDMPMPVRKVKADLRVAADVGRVALMRGPIVYALEGVDNGGDTASLVVPASTKFAVDFDSHLLDGVTVLRGDGRRVVEEAGGSREVPASLVAIPFYANSNRAPTSMDVWIADEAKAARGWTVAGSAVPTASRCNTSDTVSAMNDFKEPKSSDDESIPRFTWWDHRGTPEWVQYDFASPLEVAGVDVYWWDEARIGRDCRVPQSWHVEYRTADGQWLRVNHSSTCGVDIDRYNRVTFDRVKTTALRLVVQLQPNFSGGILEWRVIQ